MANGEPPQGGLWQITGGGRPPVPPSGPAGRLAVLCRVAPQVEDGTMLGTGTMILNLGR